MIWHLALYSNVTKACPILGLIHNHNIAQNFNSQQTLHISSSRVSQIFILRIMDIPYRAVHTINNRILHKVRKWYVLYIDHTFLIHKTLHTSPWRAIFRTFFLSVCWKMTCYKDVWMCCETRLCDRPHCVSPLGYHQEILWAFWVSPHIELCPSSWAGLHMWTEKGLIWSSR